jgi:hypothetical protein
MTMQAKRKAWILTLITVVAVLLLAACKSSDADEEEPVKQPTMLSIYVYTPDHPAVTRGDIGNVASDEDERTIHSLHIWVFTHETTPRFVGYLNPEVTGLNSAQSAVYQMLVPDWFTETKPNVDVYVMANVTSSNCGITLTPSAVTAPTPLDAAAIQENCFGLTAPTGNGPVIQTVPADGLPMSGVLIGQKVKGEAPVLRIVKDEDDTEMSKVTLVRAVSKIRFVFSKSSANTQAFTINSISLDAGVLPTTENLFLDDAYTARASKVGSSYNTSATTLVSEVSTINGCDNPASFAVQANETGQNYEDRINKGISPTTPNTEPSLSELGRFYLRESDKKLTGTISYTVDGSARNPVTFKMAADGDFSRNHTWIVYAYFVGGDLLQVNTVDVKSWTEEQDNREVYNW